MKEESLNKALNEIIDIINELDIPIEDKVELMLNITHFLDKKKYKSNIDTLNRHR